MITEIVIFKLPDGTTREKVISNEVGVLSTLEAGFYRSYVGTQKMR
jgi:hypothetical protein